MEHVSLKNAEFISIIKNLPQNAQTELMQLFNNLRSVAQVTVIPEFKEKFEPTLTTLKENGFSLVKKQRDRGISEYFVSIDSALAQEALDIYNQAMQSVESHRRFGELMGYPAGSVEAFIKKDASDFLSEEELENALGFKNHFFNLKFSKSHLEESLQYLKDSYKVLLEQAPQLITESLPLEEDREVYLESVKKFVSAI